MINRVCSSYLYLIIFFTFILLSVQSDIMFFIHLNTLIDQNSFWKFLLYFTNFYLNIFILIFLYVFIKTTHLNLYFYRIKTLSVVCIYIFYQSMFVDNFKSNSPILFEWFVINTELQNGVLLVHPILTYTLYCYIYMDYSGLKLTNQLPYFFFFFKKKIFFKLFICFLALFLGSFWAIQEIGWGGLWNWDPVELILLVFLLTMLLVIHNNPNQNLFYLVYRLNYNFFYLLIFFFSIRFDLFKSIHSFISFGDNIKLSLSFFILICYLSSFFWKYNYMVCFNNVGLFFSNFKNRLHTILNVKLVGSGGNQNILYMYLHYYTIFYIILLTINSYYFEFEFDEFFWLFRGIVVFIVFYIFFLNSFYFDLGYFIKFNLFVMVFIVLLHFYKLLFIYFVCIFYNIFVFKHKSLKLFFLHFFITLLFTLTYTRSFFSELDCGFDEFFCNFNNQFIINENLFFFEIQKNHLIGKIYLPNYIFKNFIFSFSSAIDFNFSKNFFFDNNSVVFFVLSFFCNFFTFFFENEFYYYISNNTYSVLVVITLFLLILYSFFKKLFFKSDVV